MQVTCSHSSSSILQAEPRLGAAPARPAPPLLGIASPGVGDGLPADRGDELDAEGLLLRVDVPLVCEDRGGPSGRSGPQDRPSLGPHAPLSMVSNSFSSPVMRGTRVQGVLVLVATAYTLGRAGRQEPGPTPAPRVPGRVGADLGLHVVSHVVGGAAQRDLPNRPRGVVGQVGRQNADPQLALGGHTGEGGLAPTEGRAGEPRPPRAPSSARSSAGTGAATEATACCPVLHGLPVRSPRFAQGWPRVWPRLGSGGAGGCRHRVGHTHATPASAHRARPAAPLQPAPKCTGACQVLGGPQGPRLSSL